MLRPELDFKLTALFNRFSHLLTKRYACRLHGLLQKTMMISMISLLSACTANRLQITAEPVVTGLAGESVQKVLVLNSNHSVERYQIAENYFISSLRDYKIDVMDLQGKDKPVEFLQDQLNAKNYDLIYAIGAKALGSVNLIDPDISVVYSAVLNWRRFKDHENYFGISSELSPQVQLTWFKYFFPEIKSIGVLYSQENEDLIEEAAAVAKNLGLKLVPSQIRSQAHLMESAENLLERVDTLWLISDSHILSSVNKVRRLFAMADAKKVPVFTYNSVFVEMGAVMSLAADLPTIGRQAALMADDILERNLPKESIQFPVGSRIILNSQKIREYGLKLNAGALDSVDEIYP